MALVPKYSANATLRFRNEVTILRRPDFPAAIVDWPISYDDLEPWYCEAEREMGVAGSHEEWDGLFDSPRSKPFPMSMIYPATRQLDCRANQWKSFDGANIACSTPSARNSTLYDGRPMCAGNSICVPLCPIGAKYDGTVHVTKQQLQAQLWGGAWSQNWTRTPMAPCTP